jgi:hypothetical protein
MFSTGQPPEAMPAPAEDIVVDSAAAASSVANPQAKPAPAGVVQYDWQKYARLLDEDPKSLPAADLENDRDPFAVSAAAPARAPQQSAEPPAIAAEPISPVEAGLTLNSTLLGSKRRIAEIDGESYTVGDVVEAMSGETIANFRVVEIQPRRVILESDGQKYELTIPRPLVDSAIETRTGRHDERVPSGRNTSRGHNSGPSGVSAEPPVASETDAGKQ